MDATLNNVGELAGHAFVATGELAYLHIPTNALRLFMDKIGGSFAKLPYADSASGYMHRWREGHDLLVDIPASFANANKSGWDHLGHVLITDFPTKAGIPIPGLSAGGLGDWLVNACGIKSAWLNLNIMDSGVGILAVGEGYSDILHALSGEVALNTWTFFDTFGEGTLELWLGMMTHNPLLIVAATENYLAGIVHVIKKLTTLVEWQQVNLQDVLGGTLLGGVIGLGFTALLHRNDEPSVRARHLVCNTLRAAALGGLAAMSPWFSLGAAAGLLLFKCGKELCNHSVTPITPQMVQQTIKMSCENPIFAKLWNEEKERIEQLIKSPSPLPDANLLQNEVELVKQFFEKASQNQVFDKLQKTNEDWIERVLNCKCSLTDGLDLPTTSSGIIKVTPIKGEITNN